MAENITELWACRDVDTMDREALLHFRDEIVGLLAALDKKEPKNMMSDAYADWADRHEALEDTLDDIDDRLDSLPG